MRPGARFGPAGIRDASLLLRPFNPAQEVDVFAALSIADLGDLHTTPGNAERAAEQIAAQLEPVLRAGATPITLGGDHSIVLGELRAHAAVHGPLGVVLLDAHADMALAKGLAAYPWGCGFGFFPSALAKLRSMVRLEMPCARRPPPPSPCFFAAPALAPLLIGEGVFLDARQSAMQWRCQWQSHRIKRTTSLSSNRSRQEAALATRQREARIARPGRPSPNPVSARRDRTVSSNHLEARQDLADYAMKKVSQLPNWFRPNHPRDLPLA